jgi:hypothetical protein
MRQQRTDLISRENLPRAIRQFLSHRQTVSIRVVGQDDSGPSGVSCRHRQREGALSLFGIRKLHSWESWVRVHLRSNLHEIREVERLERACNEGQANTVHRRIHNCHEQR